MTFTLVYDYQEHSYTLMDIVNKMDTQHKGLSLDHPSQSTLSCLAKSEVLKPGLFTQQCVHTPIDLIVI